MKTRIVLLALLLCGVSAFASHTCMDIEVINGGTEPFQSAALVPGGVLPFTAYFSFGSVTVGAQGLGVGSSISTYNCFAPTVTDGATYTSYTTPNSQYAVKQAYMGVDANGSPECFLVVVYTCQQTYYPAGVNNLAVNAYPVVTFSDGTRIADITFAGGSNDNSSDPWINQAYAPGAAFSDAGGITLGCGLTYTVTWVSSAGVNSGTSTNGLPTVATNSTGNLPTVPQTNSVTLPQQPPVTGSNIVWNPGTQLFTESSGEQLGNSLNNTLWSLNQQNNFDASGIIGAIKNAEQQNHSDLSGLDTDLKNEFTQTHSDLGGINNSINGLTNFMGGSSSLTNYALNSTVQGVAGAVTNVAGAVSNLSLAMGTNTAALIAFWGTNQFGGALASALTNAANSISTNNAALLSYLASNWPAMAGSLSNVIASGVSNSGALMAFWSTNQFGAGLGSALTNAAGAVNQLYGALTNISDWTNLDVMSEQTGQGISNVLAGISNVLSGLGTNIFAGITNGLSVTNYAKETTLDVITNQLAGLLTNSIPWTNGLTDGQLTNQVNDYQVGLSNSQSYAMAQMSSLTNVASVMGMGAVGAGLAGLPSDVDVSGPSAAPVENITLPSGIVFAMGAGMPSYGGLRTLLAWATLVGLFVMNWRTTYTKIRDAFTSNQAVTAGTSMLGTNVNLSSAMLVAVAIFAVATAIPALGVAVLTHEVSLFMSISGNPLNLLQSFGFGFEFLDQYIPLATVISAVCTRVVFNVSIDAVAGVVMGIKLFLVGL